MFIHFSERVTSSKQAQKALRSRIPINCTLTSYRDGCRRRFSWIQTVSGVTTVTRGVGHLWCSYRQLMSTRVNWQVAVPPEVNRSSVSAPFNRKVLSRVGYSTAFELDVIVDIRRLILGRIFDSCRFYEHRDVTRGKENRMTFYFMNYCYFYQFGQGFMPEEGIFYVQNKNMQRENQRTISGRVGGKICLTLKSRRA